MADIMHLSAEEYEKILAFFSRAVRNEPLNLSYWYDIGFCKGKLGQWQEAAAAFEKIAAEDGTRAAPLSLLGLSYLKLHRYTDAAKVLQQAVKLTPDNINSLFRLAAAYFCLGKPQKAATPIKKIIRLNPDHAKAHYGLGLIHHRLGESQAVAGEIAILQKLDQRLADKLQGIISDKVKRSTSRPEFRV